MLLRSGSLFKKMSNWLAEGKMVEGIQGRAPAWLESLGEGSKIYMMKWHKKKRKERLALG